MLVPNLDQLFRFNVDGAGPVAGRAGCVGAICLHHQAVAFRTWVGHGFFICYEIALRVAGAAVEGPSSASGPALHDVTTAIGLGALGAGPVQYRPGVFAFRESGAG